MEKIISSIEEAVEAYRLYKEYEPAPDEEVGFIQEPSGWMLFTRSGRGYVYSLFYPQSLEDLLEEILPGTHLADTVEVLARELAEAKSRLRLRNRQIRDLRRQARK
mgnify:CR=1 FL=1